MMTVSELIDRLEKIRRSGAEAETLMAAEQYYPLVHILDELKEIRYQGFVIPT